MCRHPPPSLVQDFFVETLISCLVPGIPHVRLHMSRYQGLDYRNLAVFIGSFDYIIPFNPFLLGASCKQNAFHDAPDRQGLTATGNIIPFDRNM